MQEFWQENANSFVFCAAKPCYLQKKICTFDADFLFLLSRSPQKHRSERDDSLFRYRRDLVILHVLVYHLVELSQILRQLDSNFSLMCNFCTLKMYYLYLFGFYNGYYYTFNIPTPNNLVRDNYYVQGTCL